MSKRLDELKAKVEANAEKAKTAAEDLQVRMYEEVLTAQEAYGENGVRAVAGRSDFVIVKTPHPAMFRKFADLPTEKQNTEAQITLARSCLVTDVDKFEDLCAVEPGIILPVAGACMVLAGVRSKDFLE